MAKSTSWRVVRRVSDGLLSIADEFIKRPVHAVAQNTKQKFRRKCSIPNIIGCIDCTHITIKAPQHYKEVFFDRKSNYSLILQAIVDADKKFLESCIDPDPPQIKHICYIYRDKESFPRGSFLWLKFFTEQTDLVELSRLTTSACVLHNICIVFDDRLEGKIEDEEENEFVEAYDFGYIENRREEVFNYLFQNNII